MALALQSNIQANSQKTELQLLVNRFCFPNLNPSCGKQKPIYLFGLSFHSSMYPFKTGKSRILSSVVSTLTLLNPKVTLYLSAGRDISISFPHNNVLETLIISTSFSPSQNSPSQHNYMVTQQYLTQLHCI